VTSPSTSSTRSPRDAPAAQRASRLNILGVRLSEVGDNRAALDPAREAVDIRRRLTAASPLRLVRPVLASVVPPQSGWSGLCLQ
jgi:hypothetical protein